MFDVLTPRNLVKSEPRLAQLSIMRFSQGTQFPVTEEEADVLGELIRKVAAADEIPAGMVVTSAELDRRVWVYSPGQNGEFWEDFYRNEIMAIGWDEVGDLCQYATQDAVTTRLEEVYKPEQRPVNNAKACFDSLT